MRLSRILEELEIKPLLKGLTYDFEIADCYIGDLLSNVMARAKNGDLWLTVQTHQNVVAIAVLLNLAGIVFVEGHQPQQETLARAEKEGIPLFCSQKSAYQLACQLYDCFLGRLRQ